MTEAANALVAVAFCGLLSTLLVLANPRHKAAGAAAGAALACFLIFVVGLIFLVNLSRPCETDMECYGHGGYEIPEKASN